MTGIVFVITVRLGPKKGGLQFEESFHKRAPGNQLIYSTLT